MYLFATYIRHESGGPDATPSERTYSMRIPYIYKFQLDVVRIRGDRPTAATLE